MPGIVTRKLGSSIEIRHLDVPIFDRAKAEAVIFQIATRYFNLALGDLAGFIAEEAPVGVSGNLAQSWGSNPATAMGGIEVHGSTIDNLEGRVFSSLPYAVVIDQGRAPGARLPPVDALLLWVERVLQIGDEDEARHVAWAVAKSIAKRGIKARNFVDAGIARGLPRVEGVLQIMADAIGEALTADTGA